MQKKLTISIDEVIYAGLYKVIGKRKISQFIEKLVRPYIERPALSQAYKEMADDEKREKEAAEWTEGLIGEIRDETR
ncbi:MAG: addiction module antitoxin [Candidatus Anammoxibacter sp.]